MESVKDLTPPRAPLSRPSPEGSRDHLRQNNGSGVGGSREAREEAWGPQSGVGVGILCGYVGNGQSQVTLRSVGWDVGVISGDGIMMRGRVLRQLGGGRAAGGLWAWLSLHNASGLPLRWET